MENLSEILSLAESRGKALARPYRGELTPREVLAVWQQAPEAKLVDVRTRAEWDWVGRVPGAIEVEWNQYPGGTRNPDFITELNHQPSGTLNMSRIDTATLMVTTKSALTNANSEPLTFDGINIYAVNYNVLRILSGMGGLAYSN
jgi:rhodanese-related sulfurtransferase